MRSLILGTGLAALLAVNASAGNEAQTPVFAQINDLTINQSEFEAIFQSAVRHKYYHGQVPAEELESFRKQVTEDIVTQVLVHNEAQRLGLKPDRNKINAGIDAFNLKNATNPDWEQRRDKVIPQLIERLERQELIEAMKAKIRDVPLPDPVQVKQYYLDYPDKFTEPEQLHVSVILIKVSPAATEMAWTETEDLVERFKRRIESGESFATLAQNYSEHPSAANAGDLGYLHQGVLESRVEEKLKNLGISQLGGPLRVLEGIALFRLNDVRPAQLKSFEEVTIRASELLYRDLQDAAWDGYVNALRSSANVYIND